MLSNQEAPRLGRLSWLGIVVEEPMGYVDGENLYQYVGSAPTNKLDPMGLYGGGTAILRDGSIVERNGNILPPQGPYVSPPDATATGADLFNDFTSGQGPRHRTFREGDYLTGWMQNHGYIEVVRQQASSTIKQYCQTPGATLPTGTFRSRSNGRPQDDFQTIWAIRDIASIFSGGEAGWIGTFTGKWSITELDCDACCATIKFRVKNRMSLSSASYGLGPNVQRPGQYQDITQTWEWSERLCWDS